METQTIIVLLIGLALCVYFVIPLFTGSWRKEVKQKIKKDNKLRCPHCGKKKQVLTEQVTKKKGISGGKATAAILTGGLSLIATGLSREEEMTEAKCFNCGSVWHF